MSTAAGVASMFRQQKVMVVVGSPGASQTGKQLPTPAASSQPEARDEAQKAARKLKKGQNEITGGESREDEPTPLRKPRAQGGVNGEDPVKAGFTTSQNGSVSGDSGSDEVIALSQSRRRTKVAPIAISSDDESALEVIQPPTTLKRISKIAIETADQGEDTSSEDDVVTPVRKRRTSTRAKPSSSEAEHADDQSSENLQEEAEDLRDSSDLEIMKTRTRGKKANSARHIRQQRLEELKRRRAGIRKESEEESEPGREESDYEAEGSAPEPIHHAMRRGGNLDKYEDDFLDDEGDHLGVDLGRAGVPLEFTYHANKKAIDHFSTEIEWMVHNKLNPAFDRYDEIYELAHRKLDDEFKAYAGSKFISSVWRPDFDSALKNRPEYFSVEIPTMLERKCDACNRTNHPPKHRVTFSGKPYNRKTLETIHLTDEDADDSDESSSDSESGSSKGEQSFFLGRFCAANAVMGHALYHWRYALNQNVLAWLMSEGYMTPEKIVERDNMRQKKRQKIANRIVDGMETNGIMKELYRQFKENLAAARDSRPRRFGR